MAKREQPKEINLPARIGDLVELRADGHDSIDDGTRGVIMPSNNFYRLETKEGVEILNPGDTIDTQRISRILEPWDLERIQNALSGSWGLVRLPKNVSKNFLKVCAKLLKKKLAWQLSLYLKSIPHSNKYAGRLVQHIVYVLGTERIEPA